ncbi:peptidoglycan recognition protein 1-like isoform X2 [Tigriopus californicus]|uniref:peptidoglycan recognition protein 1-like isoform X2 n=1 Tax=Tigriopus californicus TaxID=6832 RepID=UPI0027D9EDF8|nr:peptidoglycan recognition protein 1-like isoform X2 [Tigriopus californicus]
MRLIILLLNLTLTSVLTHAYNEEPCRGQGGFCQQDNLSCSGGTYASNLCPTQASNVRCCKRTSTTCPSIVTRADWGAISRSTNYMSNNARYVIVHHTTGGECYSQFDCARKVRGFQDYHINTNKWSDIGYNFLIGSEGSIFEGRGFNRKGAHAGPRFNDISYGIAFIGDFTSTSPSSKAIQSYNHLVDCLVTRGKIPSDYEMKGHRQVRDTSCPGNTLYNALTRWRNYSPGSA